MVLVQESNNSNREVDQQVGNKTTEMVVKATMQTDKVAEEIKVVLDLQFKEIIIIMAVEIGEDEIIKEVITTIGLNSNSHNNNKIRDSNNLDRHKSTSQASVRAFKVTISSSSIQEVEAQDSNNNNNKFKAALLHQ